MQKLKIHFLNTIWSDACLLERDNHFGMIDTGSTFYYPMVNAHLKDFNVSILDFIFITHFHSDHYGCCKKIIEDFNVKKLYLKRYYGLDGTTSSGYQSNEEYIENEFKNYFDILEAAKLNGCEVIFVDELGCDNIQVDFMGITLDLFNVDNLLNDLYTDESSDFYQVKRFNENFNCFGTFIKVNDFNIFLGGDVTCSASDIPEVKELSIKMINRIYEKFQINKIHLYKSCHHGGGGTNTLPLCQLINPDYTIITNTARWLDNWPTFDNLKAANSNVLILPTDYQKYIFEISDKIIFETIPDVSLFITLKKD